MLLPEQEHNLSILMLHNTIPSKDWYKIFSEVILGLILNNLSITHHFSRL